MTAMNRRTFVTLATATAGGALLMPRLAPMALAQDVDLNAAGYPTLDVTVNPDGYEGIPESLAAGRYLVTVNVAAEIEDGAGVAFLQPYGMSADDFLDAIVGGAPPEGEASPAAGGEEEGGDEEEGPLPAFIYQSHFAGGAMAWPGGSGSAVLDLTEGEWIAWGEDPGASQAPVIFTVTGEFPAEIAEPAADVTFTLVDFGIMVEGTLTAGEHVAKIDNQGAQPHFLELATVPDGTTDEDIAALLDSFITGTPVPDGLGDDDFQYVAFTSTQSIDVQNWITLTLEAGTYAAMCFFPTAGIGDPHAFHGMHTVFVVS